MASRWRHWDAGCHDSLQTVSKYQSLQHSSEGLSDGHYSSDEEFEAVPVPGAGRGRKRPPAASIRIPKNLAYPEPEKKVVHQPFRLWETQERTNYPSCSASPNCPLASQFEDDWRIQETKQMLCRVGVGRGRGRSKAEVLGKAPGRETDNGFTFSGSSGDFRAYTKQSALKQLPSHDVNRNDNARERESKTKTPSSSQTSGLLATKRLWTPDPKKRWKKDKIANPDNVEEWPDLSSDSKGSHSRGKRSPRKRKGKGDVSPPGPGVSPDVRNSPKTDDQKTLEKQHGRKSKDGGKEKEVIKPAPDLSLEAVDAVLDAEDWIRLDNLPPGVQSQEVYGILEPFGAIVECHVHRHGDHSSAVVRLADSEVCEWCVSCLNETESPFPGWEGALFCSHVRNGDSEVQS